MAAVFHAADLALARGVADHMNYCHIVPVVGGNFRHPVTGHSEIGDLFLQFCEFGFGNILFAWPRLYFLGMHPDSYYFLLGNTYHGCPYFCYSLFKLAS
jgi:hypothetical protein